MIRRLNITHYRKLRNLEIQFDDTVNFISGPNGTCKSSLLHIISNAFQLVKGSSGILADKKCMGIIRGINLSLNPKIETLTKGDKQYQNPAHGVKGSLYTVVYQDGTELSFRRHNSKTSSETMRYAVKPSYTSGTIDRLPQVPVIYLGLSRLYPYGEFPNESEIKKIRYRLPEKYQNDLIALYSDLAHITISNLQAQRLKDIKLRMDFDSDTLGVDANTISSGEENLSIILRALVSLKYFYESQSVQEHSQKVGSILLIDEFDATLHPSMQEQLLNKIIDFCKSYKIQLISTTHSLSLIEYVLQKKLNLLYLQDDIDSVRPLPSPDIYKIRMNLRKLTKNDIFASKYIPVFTEDGEARELLERLLSYINEINPNVGQIKPYLHLVDASIGAESLVGIFSDSFIQSKSGMICVLDGDKQSDLGKNIIVLPGGDSPEKFLYSYAVELFTCNVDAFWSAEAVQTEGYDRIYFRDKIQKRHDELIKQCEADAASAKKNKKRQREVLKDFYNEYITFFRFVFQYWLRDPKNKQSLNQFTENLKIMFKKTALYHAINPRLLDSVPNMRT